MSPEPLSRARGDGFEVTVHRHGAWHLLRARGELDLYTGPELRRPLIEITESDAAAQVLVDLTGVTFIDSSGLGVLIGGLRRLRAAGGTLAISGATGQVEQVLTVTGLLTVFPVREAPPDEGASDDPPDAS